MTSKAHPELQKFLENINTDQKQLIYEELYKDEFIRNRMQILTQYKIQNKSAETDLQKDTLYNQVLEDLSLYRIEVLHIIDRVYNDVKKKTAVVDLKDLRKVTFASGTGKGGKKSKKFKKYKKSKKSKKQKKRKTKRRRKSIKRR